MIVTKWISPNEFRRLTERRGFTLVELLVAMALIVFIMVILTEAFSAGTGTFRLLKAQGDMQEKLRAASNLLREDVRQPHFDLNGKKLSNLFTSAPNTPLAGYFYIQQPGSLREGVDGNSIGSFRMSNLGPFSLGNPGPALCFTVRRNGIQPSDYPPARIPPQGGQPTLPVFTNAELPLFGQGPADYRQTNALISIWAEVGWFLWPEVDSGGQPVTTASTGGLTPMPLYTLRRRVRVVIPDDPAQITATLNSNANNAAGRVPVGVIVGGQPINLWRGRYAEVSCLPDGQTGFIYFNTPSDLTQPANQSMPQSLWPYTVQIPNTTQKDGQDDWFGDDIVLSDVVSFNVRVLAVNASTGAMLVPAGSNPDFLDVPTANALMGQAGNTYNTGSSPPYRILALEITLRLWDFKTSRTRQITMVLDT